MSKATSVFTATHRGIDGKIIEVECDAANSLPGIHVVGLGSKAVDEAKERIRSAITNSGLKVPRKRITLNLAPADIPKDGSHFDLPMALAILQVEEQVLSSSLTDTIAFGELGLNGDVRAVKGIVSLVEAAKSTGFKKVLLPSSNCEQAALVGDIEFIPCTNLKDIYRHLCGTVSITPYVGKTKKLMVNNKNSLFSQIIGQDSAKRALEIAAAGHHNILLTGPPGTGKSMLAKSLVELLPPLTSDETVETTKIHSLAGITSETIQTRPFRSPHHTTSHIALVGGGVNPKPGEISLSHNGVLFLDEIPEFPRQSLESLRQPLEDNIVSISRANESVIYPANFMMVATQNPCPCGFAGSQEQMCECLPTKIESYQNKLSGPLMDRIDLVATVDRIKTSRLLQKGSEADVEPMKQRILNARQKQKQRLTCKTNSQMSNQDIQEKSNLTREAAGLLNKACESLKLSARSYMRSIKVARTIADLEDSDQILPEHIGEVLQYRQKNK